LNQWFFTYTLTCSKKTSVGSFFQEKNELTPILLLQGKNELTPILLRHQFCSGSLGTDIVKVDTTGSVVSNQALLDGYGREVSDPALSIDGNGNYVATFTAPAWDHTYVAGEIWDRGGVL
jgi:hypothetical protein